MTTNANRALKLSYILICLLPLCLGSPASAQNAMSLPDGQVAKPYSEALRTEGGLAPLIWKVADGQLPPGLQLSAEGKIEGTPTQAARAPFSFAVLVRDSSEPPQTATMQFSVAIRAAPLHILGVASAPPPLRIVGAGPPTGGSDTSPSSDGGQREQDPPAPPEKPVILGLSPSKIVRGEDGFQLTVTGLNFTPDTVLYWNGQPRATTVRQNDTTQLTAAIDARDIAQAGLARVWVKDLKTQLASNAMSFPILSPAATLSSTDPPGVAAGNGPGNRGDIVVRLIGTNFLSATCPPGGGSGPICFPGTQVSWNGSPIDSHYVSPSELQIAVSESMRKRDGTASLTVWNPGSGSDVSPAKELALHGPVPLAGGTFTHRAIVGTDVSGASSLPTQQKVYIEFNLEGPLRLLKPPNKYVCPASSRLADQCAPNDLELNPAYIRDQDPLRHPLWIWANTRVDSMPQQNGSLLTSLNVQSSSDFLNSLASSQLNRVVQGFEFLAGPELALLPPRAGVPFPFVAGHSRLSASLIAAFGASAPFATPDKTQVEFQATSAGLQRFGAPSSAVVCSMSMTTGCFQDIAFVPPDRSRFYRQYYGGMRFKTWYFLDPSASAATKAKCFHGQSYTPDDVCKQFPGIFDVLFGQNEAVTGGTLHGSVVRFDGFYPIPSLAGIYVYGTTILRLARSQPTSGQPVALTLESTPLPLSDPRVFLVNDPSADRDFFRIGMGVDLIHFIHSMTGKAAAATPPPSTNAPAGTPPAKAGTQPEP